MLSALRICQVIPSHLLLLSRTRVSAAKQSVRLSPLPLSPHPIAHSRLTSRSMVAAAIRRSARLAALDSSLEENEKPKPAKVKSKKSAKAPKAKQLHKKTQESKKRTKKPINLDDKQSQAKKVALTTSTENFLPRARENCLKQESSTLTWVMGIDEAGRGPLAGPVVAAAAVVPVDVPGITDSKKITCESAREELYEAIVASANVSWAIAVVDAVVIDEINILQATMKAMAMAASALVCDSIEAATKWENASQLPACASRKGCYVTCGGKMLKSNGNKDKQAERVLPTSGKEDSDVVSSAYYALVDGNRVPVDLPCRGEAIVKGDSKEFSIAAASILAKVTRDRLMHAYDRDFPEYNLAKHKGYPTKAHMAAVFEFGASPIHRRTFAPLKHMTFDEHGGIVE